LAQGGHPVAVGGFAQQDARHVRPDPGPAWQVLQVGGFDLLADQDQGHARRAGLGADVGHGPADEPDCFVFGRGCGVGGSGRR